MTAISMDMQEPSINVFKDIDVFVGNLPQQVIEIFFCFWRRDFLVYGIAAY